MFKRYFGLLLLLLAFYIGTPSWKLIEAGETTSFHQSTVLGRGSARIVDWGPDDELIAVGGTGGVWFYTNTLQLVSHLDVGHVSAMVWTPNDNHIAVATTNGDLVIWDATTFEPLFQLNGHTDAVVSLAWNSDGTLLSSGSLDETVRIWDRASGELVETLIGHVGQVHAIRWNADDTRLATASSGSSNTGFAPSFRDASTIIWNTQTWEKLYEPELEAPTIDIAWHPIDPTTLAISIDAPESLWLHNVENQENTNINVDELTVGERPWGIMWSPDGSQLALMVRFTVGILDTDTWQGTGILVGGYYREYLRSFTWNHTGNQIIEISFLDLIQLWNTSTHQVIHRNDDHSVDINSISWNLNGESIISSHESLSLWSLVTNEQLARIQPTITLGSSDLQNLTWSPTGNQLAFTHYFSSIYLLNLPSEEVIQFPFLQDDSRTCLAWNSEGSLLASGGEDGFIRFWNPSTQEQVNTYEMTYKILAIDWSADDTTIVIGGESGELQLLDLASEDVISIASGENEAITDVKFSPDGQYIASASGDTITVWDVENGNQLLTLDGHTESVLSISWHPDSSLLTSGGADNIVRIWDTSTGEIIATLEKHVDDVTDVEWSPDGSLLASASLDGTIRIWARE